MSLCVGGGEVGPAQQEGPESKLVHGLERVSQGADQL
jgi:hypothetical protein